MPINKHTIDNPNYSMQFFLTGPPGIGKSTAIRAICAGIDPDLRTGFYSSEKLVNGKREGFIIRLLSGEEGLLASPELDGEPRFGSIMADGRKRLGISLDFLNSVACPLILASSDKAKVIIIDEIGPMQASSLIFKSMVEDLLSGNTILVASIALSDEEWICQVRRKINNRIIHLNETNRSYIPENLLQRIKNKLNNLE